MSNDTAKTQTTNIVPVQGIFEPAPTFALVSLIGPAGTPFYANIDPSQSGLHITNSTIDSSIIGGTTPAAGTFTSLATTSGSITTVATAPTDITNKAYVDNFVAGISWKEPVLAATTGNITLSGEQTIDSVALVAGNRVLVKNQSTASQNGIYVVSASTWTRAVGADDWAEYEGAVVFVISGTGNAGTTWYCSAQPGGTLGVTALNWYSLSISLTYTAGTGLQLIGTQFSIANTTVTANTYGSASQVPVFEVNAQGQITGVTNTSIAISATQVTSGTLDSARLSGSYTGITGVGTITVGTWNGSAIANNYLANSSITINGNSVSLGGSTTVTASDPFSVTFTNSGGGSPGISFDGSAAKTVDYSTVGAPSATGTGASGTWGISISGAASSATTATTASNLAGGGAGYVPYQSASGTTGFVGAGSSGQVLSSNGTSAPSWIGPSAFLDNISSTQGSIVYRNASGWVALAPSTSGYLLQTGGAGANPSWLAQSSIAAGSATTATTATNLAGGASGSVPYQTGSGSTTLLAKGTDGQVLTLASGVPSWATPSTGVAISDDTTTASTFYLTFTSATTGSVTTLNTSSTKLKYTPSTGALTASTIYIAP